VVAIDPGHGGDEVGAANHGIVEKTSNLDFARRVGALLSATGYEVVLLREADARVPLDPAMSPGGGFGATRADLQARIDRANAAGADVFLSLHSNGSTEAGQSGVEVWYDPNRSFGAENLRLARLVLDSVLGELRAYGYAAVNRGLKDDTCFRGSMGRCTTLFVLGPARRTTAEDAVRRNVDPASIGITETRPELFSRPTGMPGVLVESLFISNAADAAVLRDERGRDAIARGIASAVVAFLSPAQ
jgi:N-acetylmuramoyl-L-alanine amidase